jgi:hypothetical protein
MTRAILFDLGFKHNHIYHPISGNEIGSSIKERILYCGIGARGSISWKKILIAVDRNLPFTFAILADKYWMLVI